MSIECNPKDQPFTGWRGQLHLFEGNADAVIADATNTPWQGYIVRSLITGNMLTPDGASTEEQAQAAAEPKISIEHRYLSILAIQSANYELPQAS